MRNWLIFMVLVNLTVNQFSVAVGPVGAAMLLGRIILIINGSKIEFDVQYPAEIPLKPLEEFAFANQKSIKEALSDLQKNANGGTKFIGNFVYKKGPLTFNLGMTLKVGAGNKPTLVVTRALPIEKGALPLLPPSTNPPPSGRIIDKNSAGPLTGSGSLLPPKDNTLGR